MLIQSQGMADQHGIGLAGVQLPIGFVSHLKGSQGRARIKPQGLVRGEPPGSAAPLDFTGYGRLRRHAALDRLAPSLSMGCSRLRVGYDSLLRERSWIG
jgi:hypothetical protein